MDATPIIYDRETLGFRPDNAQRAILKQNFDYLFDGRKTINPREAFFLLVDKVLAGITPASTTEKTDEIAKEYDLLQAKHREISAQFNDCVVIKENLERKLNEATETIAQLQKTPPTAQTEAKEHELQPTERLLQLTPFESFCLAQVEKVHAADAKELLINRFFMVYQERGNGDFDIKRITPTQMQTIKNHFIVKA